MSQKRTLELTPDEINLILRALRIAEKTFNNFIMDFVNKTDSKDEVMLVDDMANKCFDLHYSIIHGQKDVK